MKKYNISENKVKYICEKYKLHLNKETLSIISKNSKNKIIQKKRIHLVNEENFINNLTFHSLLITLKIFKKSACYTIIKV